MTKGTSGEAFIDNQLADLLSPPKLGLGVGGYRRASPPKRHREDSDGCANVNELSYRSQYPAIPAELSAGASSAGETETMRNGANDYYSLLGLGSSASTEDI